MKKKCIGTRVGAAIMIAALSISNAAALGNFPTIVNAEEEKKFVDFTQLDVEEYLSENDGGWAGDKNVRFKYEPNKVTVTADNFGWNKWGVQWKLLNMVSTLDENTFEFDVVTSIDKNLLVKNEVSGIEDNVTLEAGKTYHYSLPVNSKNLAVTMDLIGGGAGTLEFTNLSFGDYQPSGKEIVIPVKHEHDFSTTEGDVADPGLIKEGYDLIWADEFDGNYGDANVDANTGLNLDNWAYQLGDGTTDCGNYGWGNNELQCYTNNSKNIGVNEDINADGTKDGLLRITASYEENGYKYANETSKKYTSARIRTTSKEDSLFTTTYGYVESRIALPATKGAWPAFWMLPESTDIYGGWPVSGEIDILETVGSNLNQACGTLHWGVPSHVYKGSGYVNMPSGSDNTRFHTYAIDWKPGQIDWIYDGVVIYTSTNWSSGIAGASDALGFDAPFDAPFYSILNLAVDSGQFGGAANKADFEGDINMYVDYVRVFQKKDGYAKYVTKQASSGAKDDWSQFAGTNQIADITADNLIAVGGGHDDNGAINSNKWYLSNQEDAAAAASVFVDNNGKVWDKVDITKQGSQDYSVQLIGHYNAKAGYVYKISYDAFAEGAIVGKTVNCDSKEYAGWSTYGVSTFSLSATPESYAYYIEQTEDFDNCRIEFNIGAQATGSVYVSNVKVEIVDPAVLGTEDESGSHPALSNGEMIYNGTFDQGNYRTIYWTEGKDTTLEVPRYTLSALAADDVKVIDVASKTNYEKIADGVKYYERRGQISAKENASPSIYQAGIKMTEDTYTIAFDMYSETDSAVKASVYTTEEKDGLLTLGKEIAKATASYNKESGVRRYSLKVTTDVDVDNAAVVLTFAKNTKVQIDNVSMFGLNQAGGYEKNPLKTTDLNYRGDNGGGQELPAQVNDGVVSMSNITSGGNWYSPQLASKDFPMASGVNYRLSFKYKLEGTSNNTFNYILQENQGSWAVINDSEKLVTYNPAEADSEGFNTYTLDFKCYGTIPNVHLNFGFGNSGAVGDMKFSFRDAYIMSLEAADVAADNEEVDETVFGNEQTSAPTEPEKPSNPVKPSTPTKPAGGNTSTVVPGNNQNATNGSNAIVPSNNTGKKSTSKNNSDKIKSEEKKSEDVSDETEEESVEETVEESVDEPETEVVTIDASEEISETDVPVGIETEASSVNYWIIIFIALVVVAAAVTAGVFVYRRKDN